MSFSGEDTVFENFEVVYRTEFPEVVEELGFELGDPGALLHDFNIELVRLGYGCPGGKSVAIRWQHAFILF